MAARGCALTGLRRGRRLTTAAFDFAADVAELASPPLPPLHTFHITPLAINAAIATPTPARLDMLGV